MNKQTLLIIGAVLIGVGLIKPNFLVRNVDSNNTSNISAPSDPVLKQEADDIVRVFSKSSASSKDAKDLRDLYVGLSRLIKLDNEDKIVSSTGDIKQANSVGGQLLQLDLKGKCPELAKENNDVILKAVGDDNVTLSPELRNKASDAFMALAWAYDQVAQ